MLDKVFSKIGKWINGLIYLRKLAVSIVNKSDFQKDSESQRKYKINNDWTDAVGVVINWTTPKTETKMNNNKY